jgi:hypothetical protein
VHIRRPVTRAGAALMVALVLTACAEVGSGPDVPAAIEISELPSPSVVIGDTLRNVAGIVSPVRATVRNLNGDVIAGAAVRYLYADFGRDSAIAIDSVTGIVRAVRALVGGSEGRLGARVGASLQVLKTVAVVPRPDTVDRLGQAAIATFVTTLADTGRSGANNNSAPALTVVVRNIDALTSVASNVRTWPVRFEVLTPANPTNDTTQSVFLVDDSGRPSVLDTTDQSGIAGRRIRIRAQRFPASGDTASVVVRAIVTYKGIALRGSPFRLVLPVRKPAPTTP